MTGEGAAVADPARLRAEVRRAVAGAVESCNAEGHPDPGQTYDSTRPCVDCAAAAVVDLFRGPVLQVGFVDR